MKAEQENADQKQAAVNAAQDALDSVDQNYQQGALGFYNWLINNESLTDAQRADAERAVEWIEYGMNSNITGMEQKRVILGGEQDSTNLENVKWALADLTAFQQERENDVFAQYYWKDDPENLKMHISASSMAFAQISANEAAYTYNHTFFRDNNGPDYGASAESLGWGLREAGLLTGEQGYVLQAIEELGITEITVDNAASILEKAQEIANKDAWPGTIGTIGHWQHSILSTVSGVAYSTYNGVATVAHDTMWDVSPDATYTVEEIQQLFDEYYGTVNKESCQELLEAAEAEYESALEALRQAEADLADAKEAVQAAQEEAGAKAQLVAAAQNKKDSAQKAFDEAEQDALQKKDALEKAQAVFETRKAETKTASDAVALAEEQKENADKAATDAETVLEQSQAAADTAESEMTELRAAADQKKSEMDKLGTEESIRQLQADLDDAQSARTEAEADVTEKAQDVEEAQAVLDERKANVAEKQETLTELEQIRLDIRGDMDLAHQNLNAAKESLEEILAAYAGVQAAIDARDLALADVENALGNLEAARTSLADATEAVEAAQAAYDNAEAAYEIAAGMTLDAALAAEPGDAIYQEFDETRQSIEEAEALIAQLDGQIAEAEENVKAKEDALAEAQRIKAVADADVAIAAAEYQEFLTVVSGNDSKYVTGSNGTVEISANGNMSSFTGVMIDGTLIDPSFYRVTGNSVILDKSILDTLGAGKHTVAIVYEYGTAETYINIEEAEKNAGGTEPSGSVQQVQVSTSTRSEIPKTGDPGVTGVAAQMVLELGAAAAAAKKRFRKNR